MRSRLLALLLVAPCSISLASDGVLEINQTCAEGPGCFAGDDAGFPVRITNSGSYILTSNLVVPEFADGVTSQLPGGGAPNELRVSLDLNGFGITSTTDCNGTPLVCSPHSTTQGIGIRFEAAQGGTFQILNGYVQGMALIGIACALNCVVENVMVSKNGGAGIIADGVVKDCVAFRNGDWGIDVQEYARVENCRADENGGIGFSGPGTFAGNVATDNESVGFDANLSVLIGNTVSGGQTGIVCVRCTAQNNIVSGAENGINFLESDALYGGNIIEGTTTDIDEATNAVQTAPNICGTTACP